MTPALASRRCELELDPADRLAGGRTALDLLRRAIAGSTIQLVSNDAGRPSSARTLKVSTTRASRPGGCARTSERSGRSSTETWAEPLRAELGWLGRTPRAGS